jgi:hypothetical protein
MRQMANQEMKRSLRDPCEAASARRWLEKYPSRRHPGQQEGLALSNVMLEIVRMAGRAPPAETKIKSKIMLLCDKSGTHKAPGIIARLVPASSIRMAQHSIIESRRPGHGQATTAMSFGPQDTHVFPWSFAADARARGADERGSGL